jgi:Protein of unknown function (DUF3014)
MSRYDRNRNKKLNKSIFIAAILVSLLIGVSGTYYVAGNAKHLKELEAGATVSDEAATNEIKVSEGFPDEQPESLPAEPMVLAGNNTPPASQQSGLPDLLSSDDALRQTLINISPGLAQWLKTDQLIRKYTHITNDFAQGLRTANHMSFLRLGEPFSVGQNENGLTIAPKSFQRYNNIAQTIQAIDAKTAVMGYQKFRPLILQVFAEFNYPRDMTLESVVKKAAGEIIASPVIEGQIALVRPSLFYKFADPKLETLNPVQKQMIRMGPANTRIIQAKCREFLVELAKSGVK